MEDDSESGYCSLNGVPHMKNNIKYLIMDVDGTLTDGMIYIGNNGEVFKAFNIKDGYGIKNLLSHLGITPIIITGRESKILESRCKELGIVDIYQGITNKKEILDSILGSHTKYSQVSYIGDDLNDLSCMQLIKSHGGLIGCPLDAVSEIKQIADFISNKNGGDGAVREFIDWLINTH